MAPKVFMVAEKPSIALSIASVLSDGQAAAMFRNRIIENGTMRVVCVSEKLESKGRPSGRNTVNLLKVASSALGFGPQLTMQLAERLYTQAIHVQKAHHILRLLTSEEH